MRHIAVPDGHSGMSRLVTTVTAMLMMFSVAVFAIDTEEGFEDPVLDARYRSLINEIRCMKCQNQSIADSPIDVAADLRRQVHNMMSEGQSDAQIKTYLASRYGDFILYNPPLNAKTWLLWGSPLILLGVGGLIFWRVVRNFAQQPIDTEDGA